MAIVIAGVHQCPMPGQNLVSNPGFEVVSPCPSNASQIHQATGWSAFRDSPDLFHACALDAGFDVPFNMFGFQEAASGNGYGGLYSYVQPTPLHPFIREFIGSQLMTPLIPGQPVHVSFKVSLAHNAPGGPATPRYATDRIGILFLTQALDLGQFDDTVFDHAHIYTTSVILDSDGWSTISGSFVPDSAYTHLGIGTFFPDDSLNLVISDPGGVHQASYYYVDDICVSMSPQDCDHSTGIIPAGIAAVTAWIADEALTITGPVDPGHLEVLLLDPAGRVVFSRTLQGGSRITIPLGPVQSGLYLLSLRDGKGHQRIKIIAQ